MSAQVQDAGGAYVDTVFHDNVDRSAEDFVSVSLLISEPAKGLFSPFGHTAFRLQCPVFDLDYVFHYVMIEPDGIHNETLSYITGRFEVCMQSETYVDYILDSEEKHRGVKMYPLHLSPADEQRLWRLLDEEVAKGFIPKYDFFKKGCAVMMAELLAKAIYPKNVDYSEANPYFNRPQYEIIARELENIPWVRFAMTTAMFGYSHLRYQEKLQVPAHLATAWQCVKLDNRPLAGDEKIITKHWYYVDDCYLTPMRMAMIMLIISMIALFLKKNVLDYIILAMQVIMAVNVLVMSIAGFSCVRFSWLFIPFNLLPIIGWRWRKHWALPYAVVLAVWCMVMLFVPHMLVDATHIILTLAFAIILLKQSNILQRLLAKSVA